MWYFEIATAVAGGLFVLSPPLGRMHEPRFGDTMTNRQRVIACGVVGMAWPAVAAAALWIIGSHSWRRWTGRDDLV